MPHAALFVVQEQAIPVQVQVGRFNAARGFVCGARAESQGVTSQDGSFNAARGFVCGAR